MPADTAALLHALLEKGIVVPPGDQRAMLLVREYGAGLEQARRALVLLDAHLYGSDQPGLAWPDIDQAPDLGARWAAATPDEILQFARTRKSMAVRPADLRAMIADSRKRRDGVTFGDYPEWQEMTDRAMETFRLALRQPPPLNDSLVVLRQAMVAGSYRIGLTGTDDYLDRREHCANVFCTLALERWTEDGAPAMRQKFPRHLRSVPAPAIPDK